MTPRVTLLPLLSLLAALACDADDAPPDGQDVPPAPVRDLSAADIHKRIAERMPAVARCLEASDDPQGLVQVKLIIGADGRLGRGQPGGVPAPSIERSTLSDPAPHDCILEQMAGLRFERPPGVGPLEVVHPFPFTRSVASEPMSGPLRLGGVYAIPASGDRWLIRKVLGGHGGVVYSRVYEHVFTRKPTLIDTRALRMLLPVLPETEDRFRALGGELIRQEPLTTEEESTVPRPGPPAQGAQGAGSADPT
jgi:hypothetical protein